MESAQGRRSARMLVPLAVAVVLLGVTAVVTVRAVSGSGSAAPRAAKSQTAVLDDVFPGSGGWPTGDLGGGSAAMARIGYRLSTSIGEESVSSARTSTTRSWASLSVEATLWRVDGPALAGVGCAAGPRGLYLFAVAPSTGAYAIVRVDGTGGATVLGHGMTRSGTIGATGANTIGAACAPVAGASSTRLTLRVNRGVVAEVQDPGGFGPFTGVALAVVSLREAATATFKSVRMTAPSTGTLDSTGPGPAPGQDLSRTLERMLPPPPFVARGLLPAAPAPSVKADLRYVFFDVAGTTIPDLVRSLGGRGPRVTGELAYGVTYWRIAWGFVAEPSASGCSLVDESVNVRIRVKLPRWTPPPAATRYTIDQWNEFLWALDVHERTHARIAIQGANAVARALRAGGSGTSCSSVEAGANAAASRAAQESARRQRAFDRRVAAQPVPDISLP